MIQTLAHDTRFRSRVLLSMLFLSTGGAAVLGAGPLGEAISALVQSGAAVVTKPIVRRADLNLVQPFYLQAKSPAERERAVHCMTDVIYYEAANEPEEGQRAVAQVVVNRVRDKHFPKSVCGVVYEGWERRTGCQFSFVCDGSIRRRHADATTWSSLRPIAEQALNGRVAPKVGAATYYYATYVRPYWTRTVATITEIGKHIFCSWKGKAGLPSALDQAYQGGEFKVSDAALDGTPARPVLATRRRIELAHHRVHQRLYAA